MKKIILTTLISFGLAIAANAQKKGHDKKGHDDRRGHNDNRHEKYEKHKGYNNHSSHGHKSHSSHGHKGHSSYGHRSHSSHGHSSYGHSSYGYRSHGHSSSYGYTTQRVWVPGCSKRVWVPAQYKYVRRHCGTVVRVCVSHGYYNTVQTAGYYTYKQVRTTSPYKRCNNSGVSIYWRF